MEEFLKGASYEDLMLFRLELTEQLIATKQAIEIAIEIVENELKKLTGQEQD